MPERDATARDFTDVTEVPGTGVSREAIDMVWTRYAFAGERSAGKRVLEIACGPGVGLRYLREHARSVVGGDYTASLLAAARARHGVGMPLVRLDAHALPFRDASFDVVLLFEAIYFMEDQDRVLESCRRVLAPGGTLIVVTVNPQWAAFNPSPMSTRYPSARELREAMARRGLSVELFGGFPTTAEGWRGRIVGAVKQLAVRFHLIPKTMKGKEFLKKIAFGRLEPFPADVAERPGTYRAPVPLADGEPGTYKVLYAVARKDAN